MFQATVGLFILVVICSFFAVLSARNSRIKRTKPLESLLSEMPKKYNDAAQGNQANTEAMKMAASGNVNSLTTSIGGR